MLWTSGDARAESERWVSFRSTITVKSGPASLSEGARAARPSSLGGIALAPSAQTGRASRPLERSAGAATGAAAASIPVDVVAPFSVTSSTLGARTIELSGPIVCNDQFLGPLPNSDVFVELLVLEQSGGHTHEGSPSNRPIGQFDPSTGNTGLSGFDYFIVYQTPETAGVVVASIMCMPPDGFPIFANFTIGVRMEGLDELQADDDYLLVGTESANGMRHLRNHFGQATLNDAIMELANLYAAEYPGSQLAINDMSLEEGGLFDFNANADWSKPHGAHRFGADVDVEDVPESQIEMLMILAEEAGFDYFKDEMNHYHLRVF
jgi:hypothetical protein